MPRYEANEKAAFDWAATVDVNSITRDHILKAYRLNLKSCSVKPNPCKRNCNSNPKCISGLGESRLFSNKEGSSINLEDEERREPGSFAGLKNLGATCYVNSLLQVWYHNPFLREAIYKWKPEDDEKEISAQLNRAVSLTDLASGVQFSPVSPVGQLQLIFARLQFSTRRYVDPTQFVNSLQLDVSQQQDAQEFSKLFLTLLEDDLSTQKDFKVKNIVQTQYCGEYEYVTRCSNCGTESTSPSKFYELSLNIRGHKDIHQCLDEFFSPEILEGSNQYYCNTCESKQNVIRTIRLRKCPPYLNLQLLRFIYDRQKNCRRKLNSSINFPLTLDMRKYFQETVTGCTEYHLCAVLVHRGQSAHSGHYIAHIKDRETGDWYKFNDEFVEKTEGNVIKLCADGSSPPKETSSPPPPPFLSSSGSPLSSTSTSAAFSTGTSSLPLSEIKSIPLSCSASSSFSYSSSSSPLPSPSSSSPSAATAAASASSTTGVTVNPTSKSTEKESTKFSKGSSDPYMLVYKSAVLDDKKLPSDSSVQWDIPEYLQTIVVEENSIFEDHLEIKRKERDQRLAMNREKQEEMLSIYKKLIIKDNEPFEWINKNWLKDWLHSDFKSPVPPLDNSPALCPHNKLALKAVHAMKCVNSEGASILFNLYSGQPRLIDALCRRCVEFKVNSIQIRYKLTEDSKQISSILKFSLPLNEQAFWVGKESLRCWKQFALHKSENTEESETGDSDSENQPPTQNECSFQSNCNVDKLDFNFNEEIICEHGKLTCDESVRRLVPLAVWNILKSHFPLSPEFDRSTAPCEDCLSNSLSAETLKNQCRKIANEQKQQLTDLYSTKYHIGLNDMIPGTNYYLLNYQFYLEWKNFIRDPVNNDCPSVIDNSPLKCIHQRLLYPPSMNEQNNLSESKFLILKENEWTKLSELYNYESAITVRVQVNEMSEEKVIITDPAHCEPCYDQLVEMEMEKLLNYKDAKIYVRKIQNKPDDQQDPEAEDDSYDSSFAGANRKRMKGQQGCDSSQAIQSVPSPSGNKAPRRSSRRRKYRDEREFTVSSLQTLLSLKIEIMHDFKVAPYDQDLFLNEVPLQGNDRTLAELKVVPNSLIYLKVDEPNCSGSSILEEDYIKDHAPETGFKGTQLQKC